MRTPKNYDGIRPTGRELSKLLGEVLGKIGIRHAFRPELVLAAWPEVIGPRLAGYTSAVSFRDGILIIKVKNSTLYSLLAEHEKHRLLKSLQEKFPSVTIKNLIFRIG